MKRDRQQTIPNILSRLARLLGIEVKNNRLEIPKELGKGYCRGFVFNEHIRILILNYKLKENLVLGNSDINTLGEMILFKFQNIFPRTEILEKEEKSKVIPSVLIGTSRLNTDSVIQIDTNIESINIEVHVNYLKDIFGSSEKSLILERLLQNRQVLLFEQIIYPSLQKIVDEIVAESVDRTFELFFLKIKAEELICKLLMELEKRDEKHLYSLNTYDIQAIYKIKEQMLEHIGTPPVINELAICANMSPSKLKRLFKQIFGNSIFSYYQEYRIKEATRLLKEENLSVSEVGYKLGFINLSHFSRVFKKHIGMNPKQYSMS